MYAFTQHNLFCSWRKLKTDLGACESNMAVTLHNSSIHKMDTIAINLVLSNSFTVDGYIAFVYFSLSPLINAWVLLFMGKASCLLHILSCVCIYIYILFLPIFYI